jgi:hypothetical protein
MEKSGKMPERSRGFTAERAQRPLITFMAGLDLTTQKSAFLSHPPYCAALPH